MNISETIKNSLHVEARKDFVIITTFKPYVLRLLGTSCYTDSPLCKEVNAIGLSLGAAKVGIVALSISSPDKSFSSVGMFEVISGEDGRVFVELRKNITGVYRGDISDCGLDTSAVFMGVKSCYRVPRAFWGDTKQYDDPEESAKFVSGRLEHHYKILRDGNAFCRYAVGNTDVGDLEAAHLEYKMEDFDFCKQMAKEAVVLRQRVKKADEDLKAKNLECQAKQDEINYLKAKLDKMVVALRYIRHISSKATWNTWWKKLMKVRRVFIPLADHYVDVDLG